MNARELTLVLPDFVPDARLSINGRGRTHFRTLMALRDAAKVHVLAALLERGSHGRVNGHFPTARVRIEFVFAVHRKRDPDGLAGRAKPLLDALVSAGVLRDDSSDHIELFLEAAVEPRGRETRIWITERDA